MNGISSTVQPSAMRLNGKVAIITGGASGLGDSTARLFVQHGAKVIIADVQDGKAISLCNEINSSTTSLGNGKMISYIHCNVSNDTDVKNLVDFAISEHGKLDIMFNNAGIFGDINTNILDCTSENFHNVFETNVFGGFLGAKHAARVMIPRKSGVILFTASVASIIGSTSSHAYTMSKHAIIGLMKNLCVEMGEYGVRVNAISPSGTWTALTSNGRGINKETYNKVLCETNVLKGVTQEATDVAHAALFLASDEAKFVSGLNLIVDGGFSVTNPSFLTAMKKSLASN